MMERHKPFDSYYVWLGIPPEDQPPHLYRLLDVKIFESDAEIIDIGYQRRMAYLRSIKTGERLDDAERIKEELSEARRQLLNSEKKAAYDAALKQRLAIPWTTNETTTSADLESSELTEAPLSFKQHASQNFPRHPQPSLGSDYPLQPLDSELNIRKPPKPTLETYDVKYEDS